MSEHLAILGRHIVFGQAVISSPVFFYYPLLQRAREFTAGT